MLALGQLQGRTTSACGRDAGKNTFFLRHAAAHGFGLGLRNLDQLIHQLRLINARLIGLRPFANARNARTLGRLHAHNAHLRVLLFQIAPHTRYRARGSHGADKMRDAPAGLLPNLGACGFVVHPAVVAIAELIQHATLAIGLHLQGQIAGVLHAAAARGQHQLGAIGAHGLGALQTQIFGHHQNHAVALDSSHHRQRNAGVAAGGFNQGIARLDVAALLRPLDHRQRRAILDRTGRVVALELAQQHVALRRAGATQPLQGNQRRAANTLFDRGVLLHAEKSEEVRQHVAHQPVRAQCPAFFVQKAGQLVP